MNLIDLVKRKDRPLEKELISVQGEVTLSTADFEGLRMRGLRIPAGSMVRLSRFLEFEEFRHCLPRDWGWAVAFEKRAGCTARPLAVVCSVRAPGLECQVARVNLEPDVNRWHPLRFDWPTALKNHRRAEWTLEVASGDGRSDSDAVLLGIAEHVDLRAPMFAYARGRGLEIGPGVSPQIRGSRDVDVRYLEERPIEEWTQLYNKSGKFTITDEIRDLYRYYIRGDAQQLQCVEDDSLDFIFSSHVFEHLTNPLGTLGVWHRKLRRGGHVIGVAPDCRNCFDLLQPSSARSLWLEELAGDVWRYQDYHYEKWCRFTQPWTSPAHLRQKRFSIHAHYYSPDSFGLLLELACERFEYGNFFIRSARNHKDFAFIVQK